MVSPAMHAIRARAKAQRAQDRALKALSAVDAYVGQTATTEAWASANGHIEAIKRIIKEQAA
jgi:hypothetical protein